MRHIRLLVEYDGTDLCGWQRQQNGPTVQQHLEDALADLLDHPVAVTGASRTDAGVHARGQVASFRTDRTIPLPGIRRALNTRLPPQIAVREATDAPPDFHPRFSATGKHYRYTILEQPERSPRWRHSAWHHPMPLALDAMREGAAALVGDHDFAAFRAAGCAAKTTVRRIESIDFDPGLEALVIDVRGNAFLRHMVRILVGTLVDVGAGRWPPTQVAEILESRDRTRGGQTAPAHGLELVAVHYNGRKIAPVRGVS